MSANKNRQFFSADKSRSSVMKNWPTSSWPILLADESHDFITNNFSLTIFGNPALLSSIPVWCCIVYKMEAELIRDTIVQLINLYEQNAPLWDPSCPEYWDKEKKRAKEAEEKMSPSCRNTTYYSYQTIHIYSAYSSFYYPRSYPNVSSVVPTLFLSNNKAAAAFSSADESNMFTSQETPQCGSYAV